MHIIGSDLSEYPILALTISAIAAVALMFAWKQHLCDATETDGRLRYVFGAIGIWSVSFAVAGVALFNIYRLFHPPHDGRHQLPPFGALVLLAVPFSVLALFGDAFSSGTKRIVVVLSGVVMAVVSFVTILDNINW